jgi:hypothetical protein
MATEYLSTYRFKLATGSVKFLVASSNLLIDSTPYVCTGKVSPPAQSHKGAGHYQP